MNREQRRAAEKQKLKLVTQPDLSKKRILWVSNAPWAGTGYGQQTAQVVPRLQDEYEVAIAANYGLEANTTYWNSGRGNVFIYPRGFDQWSNDVVPAHARDWSQRNPNVDHLIITLFDVWVFKGPQWGEHRVASWVPIDHMPIPPEVANWSRLPFVSPIAMSEYGKRMFENVGIEAHYVPHAIEDIYQPTETVNTPDGVITSRKFLNIPEDAFVVGMNAANKGVYPTRKAFGENLLAMSIFMKKHKDVFLYMHTDATKSMGGIDLRTLIKAVDIDPNRVVFIDQYMLRAGLSQKLMALMYTGLDVLLATSYGEGFGIPTIEAQACGTPVIVSNFAASADLVGDGWKIDGQPVWDDPQQSWFHIPDVHEITQALEEAYNKPRGVSIKAMEFAEQFRADAIYDKYWKPTLKAIWECEFTPLSELTRTK